MLCGDDGGINDVVVFIEDAVTKEIAGLRIISIRPVRNIH
jgi:hypothetical protein